MLVPPLLASSWTTKVGAALLSIAVVISALMAQQTLRPSTGPTLPTSGSLVGLVRPGEVTSITTPVPLTVSDLMVTIGDELTAGQPMIRVDHPDGQRGLDELGVELERAKQEAVERERTVTRTLQSLEQVRASADASVQVTLAERDAQQVPARQLKDSIERASLAVDQARMKLQRAEKIADAGLISGQELEEARFAFRLALDDLTNATRTSESHDRLRKAQETDLRLRRSLTLKAADQQLASLGAAAQQAVLTLKQVQMRYDEAASRLADPVIRAPRAGVVTELAAHVGDRLAVGALIARIASIDPVHIDVDVSPLLANALAAGMTARVDVAAVLQKNLTATVRAIAPLPNDNGKYVALLALPNPGRARIAGLAAVVAFETAPPADLPRIDWLGNGKVLWQRAVAGAKAWVENWPALTRRAVADAKGWAEDWPALTRRAVADAKAWVESWPALTRRAVADAKAWAENWPALWRRTEADALASEEHHR